MWAISSLPLRQAGSLGMRWSHVPPYGGLWRRRDVLFLQLLQEHVQLQLHDLAHISVAEGAEHDQLVRLASDHAVEELGAHGLTEL
jgi:hypothetical protein